MLAPIGILGGTFDPIHYGHLRLAEEAREALALEQTLLIPSGQPPHREVPQTAAGDRLAMARLAIVANPSIVVDPAEAESATPSYSVLTLERLRAKFGPARPLVLLLGADAFAGLPSWHRWRELFALAHIAVANRPGHPPHARRFPETLSQALAAECSQRFGANANELRTSPAGRILPFDMTPLAISASLIRAQLAAGHSVRYLLPDSVLDYILSNHLYA
ncbi:MAG: nicotinate-nucleotide adenylyltransferase [Sterolibacteriaceae bacterium]|uniref:Probable nicotinate-nucleotide adenylyltransferase n=1 Tax=Candidatus Methylophosphatis roskildensis TaxID=2899263 RepID=A0A9D7DWM2_9PROT|nr:nicotinate-nucleotide adenylyltransferase [Candidatus Methylophosphatis roskildensis]MBK7238438.1 nicotinate-nucleotide adenylyltransferase [Sterolibacteriaceae bacterium]